MCSGSRDLEEGVIGVDIVSRPAPLDETTEEEMLDTRNRKEADTVATDTQCWQTMWEAGVREKQKQQMITETRSEAHNATFTTILLNYITKGSITKGYHGLKQFEAVENAESAFGKASTEVADEFGSNKPSDIIRTAIFVLGASSSGKTTVTASAVDQDAALAQFPLMTIDGADWRDKSEVWARYAKDGFKNSNGTTCHYKDYYEDVFQKVRADMDEWTMTMVSRYKPKIVVIPHTAVPCIFPRIWISCPINYKIQRMEQLGYKPIFLIILADKTQVQEKGISRQEREGKAYSPKTFELAYLSAKSLMSYYPDAKWTYFYNSFKGPAEKLEKSEYEKRTHPILQRASWFR